MLHNRRSVLAYAAGAFVASSATSACARQAAGVPSPLATRTTRPLRIPARSRADVGNRITPLAYSGGFDTKTAIYETLVNMGPDGRIAPGLASAWTCEDDGRTYVFELHNGARFHDGTPVDAEAVRLHFKRWVGLPEHAWLESNDLIQSVDALSTSTLRIRLSESFALLPELLAINPCSITGPGALTRHGDWQAPIGTGPWRFVEVRENGRVIRCARFVADREPSEADALVDFVTYTADETRRPIDDLVAGELDAVVDTWYESTPRDRVLELERDARFQVARGPGGQVTFLSPCLERGPTADSAVRRRIARAFDREALVREIGLGIGVACTTWAPPTIVSWPREPKVVGGAVHRGSLPTLRLLRRCAPAPDSGPDAHLHDALACQLRRAGIEVDVVPVDGASFDTMIERRDYDLLVMQTLGVPYDPSISLSRFVPVSARPSADSSRHITGDPTLSALVHAAARCVTDDARHTAHERIQHRIDQEALVVPLYVAGRVAVVRKGWGMPRLDHDLYRVDLASMVSGAVTKGK